MYDYINGVLISESMTPYGVFLTAEVNGIGFSVKTTSRVFKNLPPKNSDIKIYLSLIHKEDFMGFCGFLTKSERDLFEILQTVSGVGVKAALTLLDEFSVPELVSVVIREDARELSRAKGVGLKSAQKIVIELHDKLASGKEYLVSDNTEETTFLLPEVFAESKGVLLSLGYSKEETEEALKSAELETTGNASSEDILRISLKYLAQR